MAKINEYPQAVTINNNDLFVIDQESGGDHATKSASVSQIADKATSGVQSQIGDLTALTTTDKSSLVGAVNEVVSKTTWKYIDTIVDGGGGCDLSGYSEVLIVPYVNNNSKYNSFVYPIQEINGAVITLVGSTTHKYVGSFTLNNNILTVTDAAITVWSSCYMRIWAR